jgi:xanthine dehydrogenase accessory factor
VVLRGFNVKELLPVNVYQKIKELISEGRSAALVTSFDQENGSPLKEKMLVTGENRVLFNSIKHIASKEIITVSLDHIARGHSGLSKINPAEGAAQEIFTHVFLAQPRLIILGGGHIGAALCRMAAELDYQVILIDDRPSFASREKHPKADRLICDHFDLALDRVNPSLTDYLVIVTRGHRHDRLCLEKALRTEAAYIGMIGSRTRVKAQLQDLAAAGYPEKALARVFSPIGLNIGAVTEAEIALSILAEITMVRRSDNHGEIIQSEVINTLCRLEQERLKAVLVTIIEVKGSAPRKAGSQMVVLPDGSLIGTIGGGCTEADARRQALLCLDRGLPGRVRFNLNADSAAEEGMACGGVIYISLELLPVIE